MAEEERLLAGRYRVGAIIGNGGMANVFEGTDTRLGRTVAIKILKSELAADQAFRTRFRQEAQAASRMSHPTIVRVFDAGEHRVAGAAGGPEVLEPFIVMEHVRGRTLKAIIAEGPVVPARAIEITQGILTALEYSHRAGVVHRDIKPANVMITEPGQVKVMDFGIARAVSDTSTSVAQTTAILGTAAYFSPEQAKGETVDARTDLYSTGIVLFEMLTGRVPFRGDTAVAVAYQHVSEPPAQPSELNPAVSPALDLVVSRALTKNRYDRYQTVSEFRADLELAGAGKVPVHRVVDDAAAALFAPAPSGPSSTEQALRQLSADPRAVKTQSRPPVAWIWAGVSVVAVVLVSVMIWVMSMSQNGQLASTTPTVPSLVGMTQDDAEKALLELDLTPKFLTQESDEVAPGIVISSSPGEGLRVAQKEIISVYVSSGKGQDPVPDLKNLMLPEAQEKIAAAGFKVGTITRANSPTLPENTVMDSSPTAKTLVEAGTMINLTVSSGMVLIGDLTGQTLSAATETLQATALGLRVIPQPDASCPSTQPNIVSAQSLPPGDVPQGSDVTLSYCSGPPAPETPAEPDPEPSEAP